MHAALAMSYLETYGLQGLFESEPQQFNFAAWLAGIAQSACGFSFPNQGYSAEPLIKITSSKTERLNSLAHILGINKPRLTSIGKRNPNYRVLQIYGEKAVDLALLIKDFAPSRFRAINFFEQWKLASTREEKLAVGIAYQAAENSLHQDIPVAKYEELLWNRSLTTGILDIRSEETNGYLSVTTKNYSLLQAMTLQLGEYLAHKYEWRIEPPDLEEFWDYYKPHLHLQIINSSVV